VEWGLASWTGATTHTKRPSIRQHSSAKAILLLAWTLGVGAACWMPGTQAQSPATDIALSERLKLTGDWNGLRTDWADRGVEINLAHTGDVMAVTGGGAARSTYFSGLVEAGLSIDAERLFGWPRTQVFVLGIGTFGRDPADGTGSLHAPSNLANIDTAKLLEAWVERYFFDERLAILGGLYAADAEFDVKETAGVFINGGFGTGLDLSETGLNGPCVYPTTCLGLRARFQPTDTHYAQLAILDGVAGDPDSPRGTQIRLSGDDGLLILGEAGFQQGADEGRFLRAALGAWHYTTDFDDLLKTDAQGDPRRRQGTQGIYGLLEGSLFSEPGQLTQGLSGFLRLGMADEDVNQVRYYAGGGLVYTGLFPSRDEDVLGLGVSAAFNGDRFEAAQESAGAPVDSHELAVELTYWVPVLPWFSVQFDAQYIKNPSTDPMLGNASLVGLRYHVIF
jgi:porin